MQLNIVKLLKPKLYLLVFLLLPATLLAQATSDLDARLANGKSLLDQQQYELAMAELLPVLGVVSDNKNMPQAFYLYSVAAHNAKKYKEANERLNHLLQQYPAWPNLDEARYLKANVAFELKDYQNALRILREISSTNFAADITAMKQHYLSRIYTRSMLNTLVQQYPDDKDIAVVYADKLIAGWYTEKDKATLDNIITRFNLDRSQYDIRTVSPVKAEYNVAVLLPFPLSQRSEAQLRKNQFITDLYTGMVLARDSLAKQNISLNLFTYEASADTNQVKTVLSYPEMAGMDLIIGPVYKAAGSIISRFARQNQIIAINPLSDDISLVKNNPYLYLFQASIATQARKSADFAYDNFPQKTGIIIYSNSPDHIAFAQAYKAQYEKRGGKIKLSKPVSPQSSGGGIYSGVDFSTTGHLVVASNSMPVAVNTLNTLERLKTKVPVITYSSWLDISQVSLDQLDEQEIYFLHPRFIDNSLPTIRSFRKNYIARYQVPPSEYVYTGFDLMYYFGNILARHGAKFNISLGTEGAISGVFFQGIGFANEHDNQYVPLLKLDNLQLNVVNPVFK